MLVQVLYGAAALLTGYIAFELRPKSKSKGNPKEVGLWGDFPVVHENRGEATPEKSTLATDPMPAVVAKRVALPNLPEVSASSHSGEAWYQKKIQRPLPEHRNARQSQQFLLKDLDSHFKN